MAVKNVDTQFLSMVVNEWSFISNIRSQAWLEKQIWSVITMALILLGKMTMK